MAHRYVKIKGSPKAHTGLLGELMSTPQKNHP